MLDLSTWTDISSHQNAYQPHTGQQGARIVFRMMVDQGVVGVCIRKTIGRYHDAFFERNWQDAGDAGLKRTVYCVPFVAYDMTRQQEVMATWESGGLFDDTCDIPAWDDVEVRHKLNRPQAIRRLLPYHYAMQNTFGEAEFYTAKSVWETFYSNQPGWQQDWGLVVANYMPDLYHLSIAELKRRVAAQIIHPSVPIGWRYDSDGNQLPSELRWEQWQISADQNNLGEEYGVYSDSIDISFRQGKLATVPPPDKDIALEALVLNLFEEVEGLNEAAGALKEHVFNER